MQDERKTKEQLINELVEMRQRFAELEVADIELMRAEEALEHRLLALTQPDVDIGSSTLPEIVDVAVLQELQDKFAQTHNVASVIFDPNGEPITTVSNFSKFCQTVRGTERGSRNCMESDKQLGEKSMKGQLGIQPCSNIKEIMDGVFPIVIQGQQMATWGIGQAVTGDIDEDGVRRLAREIGVDEDELVKASETLVRMPREQFARILDFLRTVTEQISVIALQNIQQARLIHERKQAGEELRKHRDNLEALVAERTAELTRTNVHLRQEITERVQAEKALKKAKEEAEEANRAKSTFLSNMSHELRTPLNAILGFAQLMTRSQTLPAEHQENLDVIGRSGEHLMTLINDVLTMSKIEAGRTTLNEGNFDLYHLLDDLQDMFQLKADDKRLQLVFDRAPGVPQYVRTDEIKLRQVLINLLNNAVKFTEEGGVSVQVRCSKNGRLYFEVEDTGPGFSPADLEILFEPFVQTETGQHSLEGTGLGLPISRQFVQLMDGQLTASSPLQAEGMFEGQGGPGSVFKFDIRINVVTADEVEITQLSRHVIALEPGQLRYRILVVDDKWDSRQLLVKLLRPLGFEIREAGNGQEAVEVWEHWEPHLILMDMRMPVMDGYEATRRIKATTKGQATAIIAVTASIFEEEQAVVLSAGCDGFVRKPFRETAIFEAMHEHLGVRFVYEEEAQVAPVGAVGLPTAADLAALPPEWLAELRKAIEDLNAEEAKRVIDRISERDEPLATALADLAADFRFDTLQALVEEIEQ